LSENDHFSGKFLHIPDPHGGEQVIRIIDKITEVAAHIAAWMLFSIGVMVTYEVVMRKVFNSPTIWVDEIARFTQVWAVYLASAHILKLRYLITVELFTTALSRDKLRLLELFSLTIIACFSLVALYYGAGVVLESIEMGRKTSTMLGVPKWLTESAIPVGFGLLFVQAVIEFFKLVRGEDVAAAAGHQV
jgi:C4-dicarboxylate transporter DctQ subunit